MSLEKRRDSNNKYLYRSVRVGGKVTKQYIGREHDPVVRIIEKKTRLDRAERDASIQEVHDEQGVFQQYLADLKSFRRQFRQMLNACMVSEGFDFRQGEWLPMFQNQQASQDSGTPDEYELPTKELFRHLIREAKRGDQHAAEKLKYVVRNRKEVWEPYADINCHIEVSLISMIAGKNVALSESLRLKVDDLKNSIRGKTENAVDVLLVDQIAICWLEVRYTQMAALQPQYLGRDEQYWGDKFKRANSRYLAAIRELVDIREILGDIVGASKLRDAVNGDH